MQNIYKTIALPSTEYVRLQTLMLTMIGSRTALASVLRRKLGASGPVSASAVAADIAVSGRHVHFSIDGRRSEARVLTWQPPKPGDAVNLSFQSPRGLALLGLSPGGSVSYRTEGGETEFLKVERVTDGEARTGGRRPNRIKTPHPAGIPAGIRITAPAGASAGAPNA